MTSKIFGDTFEGLGSKVSLILLSLNCLDLLLVCNSDMKFAKVVDPNSWDFLVALMPPVWDGEFWWEV